MRRSLQFSGLSMGILAGLLLASTAIAQAPKPIYVISDLHFGVGAPVAPVIAADSPCAGLPAQTPREALADDMRNTEDFRWPVALCGFLDAISSSNPNGANLVIAGDFLELWQHPQVNCAPPGKDAACGCSMGDMGRVVATVLRAHSVELAALDKFLRNQGNELTIIPGNHDAALMEDTIWAKLQAALPSGGPRLKRADSGTWVSPDQRIAIEHGHQQQQPDVNAFPNWDQRQVTKDCGGEKRFFMPWGENFVHRLYTEVERTLFPLIDNLVPDSAGIATYGAYAKLQGRTEQEWARFISFNVLETSFYQKLQALTAKDRPLGRMSDTEVQACRDCLGGELILRGAEGNSKIAQLLARQDLKDSPVFRAAIDQEAAGLQLDQARALCERIATMNASGAVLNSEGKSCQKTLSTALTKFLDPEGEHMLERRVQELYRQTDGVLEYYIYGHTHEAKRGMPVRLPARNITAFNTGAFQRLMDKQHFEESDKRKPGESDPDFLKRLTHDDLAACYPVVSVQYQGRYPKAVLQQWFKDESSGKGTLLDACDKKCSARPGNCSP